MSRTCIRKPQSLETLQDTEQFELIARLHHDDMAQFVLEELGKSNLVIRIFYWINILGAIFAVVWGGWQLWTARIGWGCLLGNLFLGLFLGSSAIIPVHEILHGLGYWVAGARKIRFGGSWRKMYWYAVADEWVMRAIPYTIVALLPFLVVTAGGIIALFYVPLNYQWLVLGVILMHALNCAGDFAVIGFCWVHRGRPIFTYDQLSKHQSYFFKARENPPK